MRRKNGPKNWSKIFGQCVQKNGPKFKDKRKKWDNLATTSKRILMGQKKRGTKDINFQQANPQLSMHTFKVKTKTQQFGTFGKKKRTK